MKTSIADLARRHGQLPNTVRVRLQRGWSLEKALNTPKHAYKATIDGQTRTISAWAKRLGISRQAVSKMVKDGRATSDPRKLRHKRYITAFNRTQHLSAWAREKEIPKEVLRHRLETGLPPEVALTAPIRGQRRRKGVSNA